jgi:hypothetical protein
VRPLTESCTPRTKRRGIHHYQAFWKGHLERLDALLKEM